MENVQNIIQSSVKELYALEVVPHVNRPEPQFGDASSNIALQLAGALQRKPQEIATELAARMTQLQEVSKVEVAGPGFINIWFSDEFLWVAATDRKVSIFAGITFVVEYSCPNYFKELHAGHLYQTVYGNAVARMTERAGATVHRTNFGADVGLSAARAMWGILQHLGGEFPEKLQDIPEQERTQFIAARYVDGATADTAEGGESSADIMTVNKRIYAMHASGDTSSAFAQIYFTTREWCRQYFIRLYSELEVDQFEKFYPESSTEQRGIAEVKQRIGTVFTESQGAVIFEGEKQGLHTRVFITKEQLPTYETKDLGLIAIEMEDFSFDRRVLITGREQSEYMKVVWRAANSVIPGIEQKMTHLTNGLIRFGDGQKMSSRLGNVTTALDVISAVKNAVEDTGDETRNKQVYLGALKYELLKYKLGGDIAFDPKSSVSMLGNSGPYLQYALVRANSILAKATVTTQPTTFDAAERVLVQKLAQYKDVVTACTRAFETHTLCNYLYELAGVFNAFYEKNRVIADPREGVRVAMVDAYKQTLQDGLYLLGISAPERL
jgi:arginyl-tRNA synthetase